MRCLTMARLPRMLPSRLGLTGLLAVLLVLLVGAVGHADDSPMGELGLASDDSIPHSPTHVIARIDAPDEVARILGSKSESLGNRWYRVPVPAGWEPLAWINRLRAQLGVQLVELDVLLEAQVSPPFTANDPLYTLGPIPSAQWHLHAVDVAGAWQTSVGSNVSVAVLDSGVNNGFDGFCNPFDSEYDATTNTAGPGSAADSDGHGTHVAGSVAQCSGNATGGAGMAPEARVMPVNVFTPQGASSADVARGIDWAVDHGAKVINLSLGCNCDSQSSILNQAIDRALAADVLLVAASGNVAAEVFYPASHPAVIAVGATTFTSNIASYSARGIELDLVAPGGDVSGFIWQETIGGYQGYFGTSMAAGHVSGAAALLRSRFPTAPVQQIRNALVCSAADLGPGGWDTTFGFGLLQAGDAMDQLEQMVQSGSLACSQQPPGSSKVATIETASGFWRLYHGAVQVGSYFYGVPGDVGFFGDWDCDGVETPGLYRQSDGYVYLRNSNTQGVADITYFFGIPGDVPLAGDFNGDGCDTVSIYRPAEARFYIINDLGSGDGGLGEADYSYLYGVVGDVPFIGDWNGNGVDTAGLRRDSDGFVYLRNSNTQGVADVSFFYGVNGDAVFAGDWDADGDDTIGLYRPSNGVVYLRNSNTTGVAEFSFWVGSGKLPASGDF